METRSGINRVPGSSLKAPPFLDLVFLRLSTATHLPKLREASREKSTSPPPSPPENGEEPMVISRCALKRPAVFGPERSSEPQATLWKSMSYSTVEALSWEIFR